MVRPHFSNRLIDVRKLNQVLPMFWGNGNGSKKFTLLWVYCKHCLQLWHSNKDMQTPCLGLLPGQVPHVFKKNCMTTAINFKWWGECQY